MSKRDLFIILVSLIILSSFVLILVFLLRGRIDETFENGFVIDVISNPKGATVYIGEKGPFITPEKVSISPGKYDIWAFKENFYILEKEIEIKEGSEKINLILTEVPIEIREGEDIEHQ